MTTLETYGPHNAPNKFYNKNGSLTDYSLHCGYCDIKVTGYADTQLYHEGCYHIRTHKPNPNGDTPIRQWDVADSLTEARKIFARHIHTYHTKGNNNA